MKTYHLQFIQAGAFEQFEKDSFNRSFETLSDAKLYCAKHNQYNYSIISVKFGDSLIKITDRLAFNLWSN